MLKGEVEQRNLLSQQQTDSVRYLNELNTVGCFSLLGVSIC